ncbi:MAG: hypothetical protein A4E53_02339 [Pelotomaculum sp. PtaB.Bin104]|nr:MAG: hypothetical protein A4E53_02339 [Pelotomaculum sp. PtaB.Bin104]
MRALFNSSPKLESLRLRRRRICRHNCTPARKPREARALSGRNIHAKGKPNAAVDFSKTRSLPLQPSQYLVTADAIQTQVKNAGLSLKIKALIIFSR